MTIELSGEDAAASFGPPLPSAPEAEAMPPDVAAALDRMQARDDALFVATSMADLAARHGAALHQAEAAGDGPADGFTARVGDAFARDLDGMVAQATAQPGPRPSDAALELLRRQADGLRQGLMARAAVHEDALRRRDQTQSVAGALDGLHGLVAADPASLPEADRRLGAVTGAAASLVGGDAAAQLHDLESRRLAAAAVEGMIAEDPAAALHALSSGAFDHRLDDATKAQLAFRAAMRGDALAADAERASRLAAIAADQASADQSFRAVSDLAHRIDAGQASHADIADAESRGTLTGVQAFRLRGRLAAADQARAADAAAATRVARALGDGDQLDPSSAADRAAVDAHWRSAIAPSLDADPAPDAASSIGDYVKAAGLAPADAVRRLIGQCFDGAPAARVAASRTLRDCLGIDPRAGDDLPSAIHDAVMRTASLADSGLPADKAIMLLDNVDLTPTSPRFTSSGQVEDMTMAEDNDAPGAANTAARAPKTNTPIPPKPAYKKDVVSDSTWRDWIGALAKAGFSDTQRRVYQEIFAAEGGNTPDGERVSGIGPKTIKDLIAKKALPRTMSDLNPSDLTADQKVTVYRAYLENAFRHVTGKNTALDRIGDDQAAAALADTLFRHGGGKPGNRIVQNAINDVVPGRVAVDGVLGNDTLAAYGELAREPATKRALLDALADRRREALKDEAIEELKREAINQGESPDRVDPKDARIDPGEIDRAEHFRFLPQLPKS
jgi:hypothetical protein